MQPEETPRISPFCADLQSKKLAVQGGPALVDEDVLDASNHCWCAATSQILGPDREPAHPSTCRAGRACFHSPLQSML